MGTWTHKFVATKRLPNGKQVRVTAGLHYLEGNKLPYFSVTAELFVPGREPDDWGCLHGLVLEHWPELAPVVAIHLSYSNGEPSHAKANGWYWLAGAYGGAGETYQGSSGTAAKTQKCLVSWAKHVRIPVAEASALAASWGLYPETAHNNHDAWIDAQAPRWQAEADAAVVLLDRLIAS